MKIFGTIAGAAGNVVGGAMKAARPAPKPTATAAALGAVGGAAKEAAAGAAQVGRKAADAALNAADNAVSGMEAAAVNPARHAKGMPNAFERGTLFENKAALTRLNDRLGELQRQMAGDLDALGSARRTNSNDLVAQLQHRISLSTAEFKELEAARPELETLVRQSIDDLKRAETARFTRPAVPGAAATEAPSPAGLAATASEAEELARSITQSLPARNPAVLARAMEPSRLPTFGRYSQATRTPSTAEQLAKLESRRPVAGPETPMKPTAAVATPPAPANDGSHFSALLPD